MTLLSVRVLLSGSVCIVWLALFPCVEFAKLSVSRVGECIVVPIEVAQWRYFLACPIGVICALT